MPLLNTVILRSTRALQPAATTVPEGTLYCVTDEGNLVERSSGTAWQPFGGTTGGSSTSGTPGVDGQDGEPGEQGPPGVAGTTGTAGATGATGLMGPPGADGLDGADGTDGSPGAKGDPGATGATGTTGATGPSGLQGLPGIDGVDGLDGEMGPPGPRGAVGPGGSTVGTATLNFGAFPGASDASLAITGQAAIASGSVVHAWLRPAATADHTADEHVVETIRIEAGNIVAGTGFTIYGLNTNPVIERLEQLSENQPGVNAGRKGRNKGSGNGESRHNMGTRIYGQWSVQWMWV